MFPPSYPHSKFHSADPKVEIERSPMIAPTTRAYLLRTLKGIRRKRPCLHDCLSFLLGMGTYGRDMHSDSSDDDEHAMSSNVNRGKMLTLARGHQNIPEFRTVQGMLSPNGEFDFSQIIQCISLVIEGEIVCHRDPTRRIFGSRVQRRTSPAPPVTLEGKTGHTPEISPNRLASAILQLASCAQDNFDNSATYGAGNDVARVMEMINWRKVRRRFLRCGTA